MYCPNCGKNNPNDATFCAGCGAQLGGSESGHDPGSYSYGASGSASYSYGAPSINIGDSGQRGVAGTVRSILRSKMFLAVALLFSVSFVASIIYQVSSLNGSTLESIMDNLINQLGHAGLYIDQDLVQSMIPRTIVISYSGILVGVLPLLGFWLLYASAKDNNSDRVKPGGIVLLRVLAMLQLIFVSIACGSLAFVLIFFGLLSPYGSPYGKPPVFAIALPIMILLVGIMVFMIICYAKIYRTAKSVETALKRDEYDGRASKFAGVVMIVLGGLQILSSLSNISSMLYSGMSVNWLLMLVLTLLNGVALGLAYIYTGTLIIQYKNSMTKFLYSIN